MKVKLKVVEKELESGSTLLPADRILCFPWHLAHKELTMLLFICEGQCFELFFYWWNRSVVSNSPPGDQEHTCEEGHRDKGCIL